MGDDPPRTLEHQLLGSGRMVAPVGKKEQHLVLTRRAGEEFSRERLEAVQFVPLVHGTQR